MRTLIYSKLEPASGNATSALRLAEGLRERGEVFIRALPPNVPDDPAASAREIQALRQVREENGITLAIGIHCYRAGTLLQLAFGDAATQTPYVLVASGTDVNVNLQKKPQDAALTQAIAHAAGLVSLSPDIFDKLAQLLAGVCFHLAGNRAT